MTRIKPDDEQGDRPTAVSLSSNDSISPSFPLFAKHENALLSGEAHFLHLSVFAEQHRVVVGFRVAILPAPFAFGHHGFALLHGGFVAVDQQAVLTGLQVRLADLSGLPDAVGLADWLGTYGHGQRGSPQQHDTADKRVGFHACQLPFHWNRVSRANGAGGRAELTARRRNAKISPKATSSP